MSETAGRVFEDYVVGSVLRHPLGRTIIDADTPDGFYRSGDLMRRHPSGSYVVEGRKKDVINRGGEKISAEEIQVQKLPERLEIMAEFPLSPIGKVSKKDLMAMVAKQVEAGS